jgi:hypothetical protein
MQGIIGFGHALGYFTIGAIVLLLIVYGVVKLIAARRNRMLGGK